MGLGLVFDYFTKRKQNSAPSYGSFRGRFIGLGAGRKWAAKKVSRLPLIIETEAPICCERSACGRSRSEFSDAFVT